MRRQAISLLKKKVCTARIIDRVKRTLYLEEDIGGGCARSFELRRFQLLHRPSRESIVNKCIEVVG